MASLNRSFVACLAFAFATVVSGQASIDPSLVAAAFTADPVGMRNTLATIIYFNADPDGGVSRGSLVFNAMGQVVRFSGSSYTITLNNGTTEALSPSVTHSACATLGLLNATSASTFTSIRTLGFYYPPSVFYLPANSSMAASTDRGTTSQTYIAGNGTRVSSGQSLNIPLDSTQNNTLLVGYSESSANQLYASARFRPVGADCNSSTFGPRRDPVVVVAQGMARPYPSFFIDPIAFSNATCAKVSLGLNSSASDNVPSDATVSLYLIANGSLSVRAGATFQSTPISLRVAPGGANFTTAVVSGFKPTDLHWFNASVRGSDFTSNSVTMSLRAAFMTEPDADCSTIPDSTMSSGLVSFRSTAPQTTATGAPVQQPATLSPPVNLAATISLAPASSGSSLSTGAIVGIAIGAAAAVIAILSLAVYLKNRNFGRKMSSQRSMSGGTVGGSAYYNQSYASSEFMGLNEIKLPINSDESGSLSSSKFGQSAPSPMP